MANIILLKSMFTSYYIALLLKQTTEVKTLSLPHVTQFQNCRLAIPQTVSRRFLTAEACVRARIIPFGFVTQKKYCQWCRVYPGTFSYPCRHPYTSATYLNYDHRRRYIISCIFSFFIWNFCLCHCQKYQWSARSVRRVSAYPELSGFVSEFEHLFVFMWSDSKPLHNYTGVSFLGNYPSYLW